MPLALGRDSFGLLAQVPSPLRVPLRDLFLFLGRDSNPFCKLTLRQSGLFLKLGKVECGGQVRCAKNGSVRYRRAYCAKPNSNLSLRMNS